MTNVVFLRYFSPLQVHYNAEESKTPGNICVLEHIQISFVGFLIISKKLCTCSSSNLHGSCFMITFSL